MNVWDDVHQPEAPLPHGIPLRAKAIQETAVVSSQAHGISCEGSASAQDPEQYRGVASEQHS